MKFTTKTVVASKEILANDHYVALEYDCSALTSLATDNIIKAGTIIPSNDANAIGVLLYDVNLAENPNGAVVVHGFVNATKLDTKPVSAAITALAGRGVQFVIEGAKVLPTKCAVTYDLNGATGTAVTDSSSPYSYGSTVTVKAAPTVTDYPSGTTKFDKWNTKADGTGTSYAASATFTIYEPVTLYAIYKA